MDLLQDILLTFALPLGLGFIIFFLGHELVGLTATNLIPDEDRLMEIKIKYLMFTNKFQSVIFFWGFGTLIMMMVEI